jgi:rapamycin-insensitive companion of mTOR
MFTMLLSNAEGRVFLDESKLLKEIAYNLEALDPSARTSGDPLFSKHALEDTMCYGYFAMLGTLSGHKDGIAMLDHHSIFTSLYHILDLRSREDLVHLIITELDYHHDSHTRIILSKALTTCGKEIRLFATSHLAKLVEMDGDVARWATKLLVTQLYDPSLEVCRLAVKICTSICGKRELLEDLVHLRPMLDHLGEIGAPLLLGYPPTFDRG